MPPQPHRPTGSIFSRTIAARDLSTPYCSRLKAGSDEFVTEKYADQIADILAQWSAGSAPFSADVKAIDKVLTADFVGSSLLSVKTRRVRSGPPVEVEQHTFQGQRSLGRDPFLTELRSSLSAFVQHLTAEFQITSINAATLPILQTRVRYELVGTSRESLPRATRRRLGFGVGADASGKFLLQSWQALEETRSRSLRPVFADITAEALGRNPSYSAQLLRGTDYWRTVLDGACGIDIYGHNGVSVGDIDDDGFDDLYICQPAGLAEPPLSQSRRRNV